MSEIAHEGQSTHRLDQNPLERKFHDAWKQHNKDGDTLSWLLGDGSRRGHPSDRDAMVAATVVQWLGSPVGARFVARVMDGEELP
jgi:hypothetical protein